MIYSRLILINDTQVYEEKYRKSSTCIIIISKYGKLIKLISWKKGKKEDFCFFAAKVLTS
jgi:hypothetical protein